MRQVSQFQLEHIGADLFPAITSGLYKDPLDALREYIQNAIDAKAKRIDITLSRDVISIGDNGLGMSTDQAVAAIRLGISDKNPIDNIGFRGIGIYSGFEICDDLEIHTWPQVGEDRSLIKIHFGKIRHMLASEDDENALRKPSRMHLLHLLNNTVTVEDNPDCPLKEPGTLVIMLGVRSRVLKRLTNADVVIDYLQNTVSLRFDPEFKFAKEVEEKFRVQDYQLVDVVLKSANRDMPVFRPYTDHMFAHGGKYPMRILDITNRTTNTSYGFIWACINDARKVLSATTLRGLLIKKYGFSIANRAHVESFFPRSVIARRVTGEIIVQHPSLIPNAARTDFESNETRTEFQLALSDCLSEIDRWGEDIQSRLKAVELLDQIAPRIYQIHAELPGIRRDVEELLKRNIELANLGGSLQTHTAMMQIEKPELYADAVVALQKAQETIRDILTKRAKAKARKIAEAAASMASKAPDEEETEHRQDRPKNLTEVLQSLDVAMDDSMALVISYIDDNIIRLCLSEEQYDGEMDALREYLEDRI